MSEEAFNVTAKIGLADYNVTILPIWDKTEEDSYFTVNNDGKLIGVLKHTDNDNWVWAEGGLSEDEANSIGDKIDAYYA